MAIRILIFLVINFAALGLGGLFTGKGVPSDWYQELNKAPWTPPGWAFGAAWTLIMILFSFYMAYLWKAVDNQNLLIGIFIIQWLLNVGWNPTFFYFHNAILGLVIIISLTLVITYFLINYWSTIELKSLLILPYFIWLLIATSLNAYVVLNN
ncbi:tryptophan-rich sensory protein [Vicingus serpentipes]|uniref:Tryptophan-rich sensory protein n=1 Tax=Vicingus serpentipes TaxID=1926625 RepID=A0A5C6RUT4_9FLAO|nr:TspO/MBR family protein [Vicingus serpentipes]TXB65847.1 tryptophan-rich sensory protein [Vicingus serpentipes]